MLSSLTFLLYLVYPAAGWIYYPWQWRHKPHPVVFFLLLCVVGYVLYVMAVALNGWELQRDLYSYDLDGDGEFSADEQTPEMKLAMQRFANDTGRTIAPIVAAPTTLAWVTANLVLVRCGRWICRKRRTNVIT